jgi:hypothetical protein
MSAFENTDAAFTARAPLLELFEPTLLLPLLAGGAFGVVARNGDPANPHLLGLGLVSGREESGIGRHALGRASELFDVLLRRSCQ